ncbi:hypothetical protein NQ318_002900 [Aromia moschata]|uniref:Reverse transcriptase domain-containing protein n=1 Tax=Aromia moschata TaxID=1265417 RepID=A0AAV8X6Z8_9CUCU|nr:hypothetical protein NQ318_002900 [Aromia moschata]
MERIENTEHVFADDIVITASSERELQHNLNIWNMAISKNGLKINSKKTKVMKITREKTKELKIKLEGKYIEQVNSYKYLGVTFEEDGKMDCELNKRIGQANRTYFALNRGFIEKKEISKKTKMRIYKAVYRPILTYGCESWVLNEKEKVRIGAMEMKYLRKVKGVNRLQRHRNEDISRELEIQPITEYIEKRQLEWWGHLMRLPNNTPIRKIWEARSYGKRKRGRPEETWDDTIKKIMEKKKVTIKRAKEMARDRKTWRKFTSS